VPVLSGPYILLRRRFENVAKLGITAGASAPESLVQELISACRDRYLVEVKEVTTATESLHFKLPKPLVA